MAPTSSQPQALPSPVLWRRLLVYFICLFSMLQQATVLPLLALNDPFNKHDENLLRATTG